MLAMSAGWSITLYSLACLLVAISATYRYVVLRRQGKQAQIITNRRIQQTDRLTDYILQGVQGLVLTFHVAAQNISKQHKSRQLMDHALLEADELLSDGRRRFEEVAFEALEPLTDAGSTETKADPGKQQLMDSDL